MTKFSSQMKWSHFFKIQHKSIFKKILKQQFTYTIKLSQFDSSPDKAPQNNPLTYFFFLKPLHSIAQLANVKNPWKNNGYTSLHKAAPFGFFNKKSPKLIKTWKLFFKKHNNTNTKISGRLSQPWQLSWLGQGRQACY